MKENAMTVRRAIEVLRALPPDAVLMWEDDEGYSEPGAEFVLVDFVETPGSYDPRTTWYYRKDDSSALQHRAKEDIIEFQGVVLVL